VVRPTSAEFSAVQHQGEVVTAAPQTQVAFVIRPAVDDDLNFIRSTWMKSLQVPPPSWPAAMRVRDRLLDRCPPIVASLDGVPTSVIAWACFEPDIIHFVFTRERWQRQGLATALLEPFADKPTVMYTHQTPCLRFMPMPRGWIYNPYEVERGEE
jgi:GNAT superfamily N-acetyltransferase